MIEWIREWMMQQGVSGATAGPLVRGILIFLVVVFSILSKIIARRLLLGGMTYLSARTHSRWDDIILERKVLSKLSHFAPAMVIYIMAPLVFEGSERWIGYTERAVFIYMIVAAVMVADSLLNAVLDIYQTYEVSKEKPIKGIMQVLKIVLFFIGAIFIFSVILNRTPVYFLSGLGALTAVLMLIFKDTILGFVAGIQLTTNRMIAQGDWIEMPKYGADGDVMEVALTTVKVRNFDKTITTIPTYALISESFKNWRGMKESDGRRIKRALYIDISTIKFCNEEMIERFSRIRYIAEYIEQKKQELAEYNATNQTGNSPLVNRRRLTNIGTLRAYITAYLRNNPMINSEMTLMVRQLPPTEHGLPLEIYVFCKDKVWVNYEAAQADLFDHILAIIPEFDLKVFQYPAGDDFRELAHLSSKVASRQT